MLSDTRKTLLPMQILAILMKFSDQDHRLTQREILDLLRREYDISADRKTVARNIKSLLEFGYDIEYDEIKRNGPDGEEQSIMSGFYYVHDFSDSELRLLIDSLLFSKHIPHKQRVNLIGKLENLSSKYFSSKVKHIRGCYDSRDINKQIFYTVETLDNAISVNKRVCFKYGEHDIDKKLKPRLNKEGKAVIYYVNPYQMVAVNGRYYLIANMDIFDQVSYYRLDRIIDIQILDRKARPMKDVKGLENGLDLPRHMAEHIYMFAGNSINACFSIDRARMNDVMDWFDSGARIKELSNSELEVVVKVNEEAMFYWCLQYGSHVELLEPKSLRERLALVTKEMSMKYNS